MGPSAPFREERERESGKGGGNRVSKMEVEGWSFPYSTMLGFSQGKQKKFQKILSLNDFLTSQ